jgi:hypothetical protein
MNTSVSIDVDYLAQQPIKTLLRLVDKHKDIQKNVSAFNIVLRDFSQLFLELEAMDIEPSFDFTGGSIDINFAGDGPKLAAIWQLLRRVGYEPDGRPNKGDVSYSSYWRQDGYANIWIHFSSTVCKRVQVGTKTVEQPIYETRCDSISDEVEALEQPAQAPIAEVSYDF